jgi:ribosome maturation factor RimP
MDDLIKEIYKMVVELRKISEANNDLLGFICTKVAPNKKIHQEDISVDDMMSISMEMSEMFEKYDVMPDEYGLA